MNLGPFLFAQPIALLGLLALPILWFLLRATPPEPKRMALPSLALLEGLKTAEETPSRTPLWLILLRMAALALAILGFARPSWAPNAVAKSSGDVLIVVDDGWTSAERWRDLMRTASSAVDDASANGSAVHILFTAPKEIATDPAVSLDPETARQQLRRAWPAPWAPDRLTALKRLQKSGLKPGRIVWASDGFDHDSAPAFAKSLAAIGTTEVRVTRPKAAFAITSADSAAEGARVSVVRAVAEAAATADVIAETAEGASIASTRIAFRDGETTAQGLFTLPAAALNRVARFRIAASPSAGSVWLWDDSARRPSVGLADTRDEAQPLLSEHYYVHKALQPYAQITERPLEDLLKSKVDAIVLGDRGSISEGETEALIKWIDGGGVLLRFAGPRLAAQNDALTPAPLRPTSRAMGGALAWETPQRIAEFAPDSPFFGIPKPTETVVRRQVLAQPSAELAQRTWARLEDGTPLVTAERRGRGELILFHITADPDWSDLPLTGAFVEMLRRAVVSGGGKDRVAAGADGALTPLRTLDGFGQLGAPPRGATPIQAQDFAAARPGPLTPPGMYGGRTGEHALNAGAPAPIAFTNWPPNVQVKEALGAPARRGFAGPLIGLALAIVAFDLLIALAFAGRLRLPARAALVFLAAAVTIALPAKASAQNLVDEASQHLRFAYVKTGDARLDDITRAGLFGLSVQLGQRTSVEPDKPHGIDLAKDALEFYPMIYYAVPRNPKPLSPQAVAKVNAYLRTGGAFIVDTRDAAPGKDVSADLETLLKGIDAPPLQPAPANHVLTKSYYLIKNFPGRLNGRLWIERSAVDRDTRRGDGVSGLFIGGSDWAGAWAIDEKGAPLLTMDGGDAAREMTYRFGINLVMYILTGNYKEDQVHVPALLERLGKEAGRGKAGERDTN